MTKFEGQYKCKWPGCHFEFSAIFGKYETKSKKQNGTSTVKCPKCGNAVKPITDAIKLTELKEEAR